MNRFKGVIPALFTPFDGANRLNCDVLPKFLGFLKQCGAGGFFVCGSSGEGLLLNISERKRMAEAVVKEIAGELPVVVHVGAMNQSEAVELAKHAGKIKAQGVSAVIPFYYDYSLKNIMRYYEAIAKASDLPVIVYYLSQTGSTIFSDMGKVVENILALKNIYGIKFTAGNLHMFQTIKILSGKKLRFYGGQDQLALQFLATGVDGIIGLNYNYLPEIFAKIYREYQSGYIQKAVQTQEQITKLLFYEFRQFNRMTLGKTVLKLRGINIGSCRPPLGALAPKEIIWVAKKLSSMQRALEFNPEYCLKTGKTIRDGR